MLIDHSRKQSSRKELLEKFKKMGFSQTSLEPITTNMLAYLLELIERGDEPRVKPSYTTTKYMRQLSTMDKKILKSLLSYQGNVSSLVLSKELGIPLSTVQRRRKRLEQHLLDKSYTLKAASFGLRTAELFISTKNGMISAVAKELLSMYAGVESVSRVIGTGLYDLRAKIVFRNNSDLLNLVERIKSLNYVESIFWIEVIEKMGKNNVSENLL